MRPWRVHALADHYEAALRARIVTGEWVLAGTYRSSASAKATAHRVPTGTRMPAYRPRPAGAFQARTEPAGADTQVWVRYLTSHPRTTGATSTAPRLDKNAGTRHGL